ncbi:CHY zinc finger domain protein [Drechmeria coniospora]|uniref:CHY zinc finger domain protein n=1 Tax=Drechmeria coniospora TaxID=98403 RepID=A0A151GD72_DRECN|nr:CHY zinc finger domain protein [Drechmeria coniospora]KYK55015.1 CHY zinc finger domain protein [Drechmeria coniospora]ODA82357.1 hypothetical protein RJ55_00864 [Drechmeria coniospora]
MISLQPEQKTSPGARAQAVTEPALRVVSRPVPSSQAEDPRGYQLEQLRRRFSPKEWAEESGSTVLVFKMAPSDPDFPFELAYLHCELRIPARYPDERPSLRVRNSDMPRGFGINIERGWERLAEAKKAATILSLVHSLDRNLEKYLSEQKAETVKLVTFKDTKDTRHLGPATAKTTSAASEKVKPESAQSPRPYVPEVVYTREQVAEAKARRAQEVRQLEARMGRVARFSRSADGVVFTIPMEPKRRSDLSPGLRSVNSLHLIVPLLYPLQDLRVQLNEAEAVDAEPVEDLFAQKAAEQKQMSLTSHVNYLAQNLHSLEKQARTLAAQAAKEKEKEKVPSETQGSARDSHAAGASEPATAGEKTHVKTIPRPPEWDRTADEEVDSSSSSSETEESDGGVATGAGEADGFATKGTKATTTQERGTMMSFPSIELHGIEVIQVSSLGVSVKCERCKTVNDMTGLKPGTEKVSSCKKCATQLTATFHQRLVHQHSARAGFLDLSGCKVADMLPSSFVPTCSTCSTAGQGLVSVRGESTTNVCRECHGKFTFKIPEVKFLFISAGSAPPPTMGPRRKMEKLGLQAGEPLPGRGTCEHYRKSYRWFRFSCCSKVHACDRCHDEAEDHVNEWANRMICGWCSREQHFSVTACSYCGRSVVGRKGKGFWEGGRGTRDQRMMSRKDPRKYKRLGPPKKETT